MVSAFTLYPPHIHSPRLPLTPDDFVYPLDGVNQWQALTSPSLVRGSGGNQGPGGRPIVHEIGGDNHIRQESYFDPPYKLIRFFPTIYNHGQGATCTPFHCPLGWNPLHGHPVPPPASENATNTSAPGIDAFKDGGTWLFDVFEDPLEHHDLSQTDAGKPIVARMIAALSVRAAMKGVSWSEQAICPGDPRSNPQKFFNGTVTPWRGKREPSCNSGPDPYPFPVCLPPSPPGPSPHPHKGPEGVVDGLDKAHAIHGWCSHAQYGGPPLEVRVQLDGEVVANATASLPRPTAGKHGFEVSVSYSRFKDGNHRFDVACLADTTWFNLKHSPLCTKDGVKVVC